MASDFDRFVMTGGLSRRDFLAAAGAASAGLMLGARAWGADAPAAAAGGNAALNAFFDDFAAQWVRMSPDTATSLRYFKGAEQDALERQLTPARTQAWRAQRVALARTGLARLAAFPTGSMDKTQRIAADLMKYQLADVVQGERFEDYGFPLEQMNGDSVRLVETLTIRHTVLTPRDAENYLAALAQVPARMDEGIAEARRLESKGVRPPGYILRATITQMRGFAAMPAVQNPFVALYVAKLAAIQSLDEGQRQKLGAEAAALVQDQVYPAWGRAIALLESQQAKATEDGGLWRLKGGDEAYAFFLHTFTTTKLTAAQIHKIGLDEVARIEGLMDGLFRKLGRTTGTVKERIERLKLDMQYPDPTSEASRAKIMEDINGILADALVRSKSLFDIQPKAPIVAVPTPTFREANAAANYNTPAPDGSRPGTFQYPRRVGNMTRFGLRSIVYHETVPGHHFQLALQQENETLPRFWKQRLYGGLAAVTEGWALYAERLAAEAGWYEGDIEGQLGQLDYELFRARRLVVDTGLHAMKWTRQAGIDYGIEASEVERYTVYPGQACSYMIGELNYVAMRDEARRAMGARFTLNGFHDFVLQMGILPIDMQKAQLRAWAAGRA
jgi:uncharacterized protein (DUF885 family)